MVACSRKPLRWRRKPIATALITHPACFDHRPPEGHPERPDRLRAILAALEDEEFQGLVRMRAEPVNRSLLARVHDPALVAAILDHLATEATESGFAFIDGDTAMSAGSAYAALLAAGAVCQAVEAVAAGEVSNAFCAIRPPGHHAERGTAMGFCLFNNVAAGAYRARELGFDRVAIVDFDVHHGNGTQDIFWNDADTLYISTHQMPLYPGTGQSGEHGAHGNILNIPLPPYAGSDDFRKAFERQALPALEQFGADFVFVSAGFDAHREDPLANLAFTEEDFAWATRALCAYARSASNGRVVSTLEGGYDLGALARSVSAHVRALMEF